MTKREELVWDRTKFTIKEVTTQKQLPIMVKVSEGIYNDCEAETFSQGDLININNVIDIPKVVACFTGRTAVREDEEGYIQQEQILIPLRYKGNLKIVSPYTGKSGLTSVRELCNHFPRYIKNLRKIKDDTGELINAGETLELDRIIPDKGLVLKSRGCNFVLSKRRREEFLYLPDPTEYTLEGVTNRFPLPMFVNFLDNEFHRMITRDLQEAVAHVKSYEGANLKLLNVVQQKVIVGHHKSAELAIYDTQSKREQSCQRTVVILPWDSEAAEIKVFLPRDTVGSTYETLSAMNFSRRELHEESVDGTLYFDMVKTQKAHVYEEVENPREKVRTTSNSSLTREGADSGPSIGVQDSNIYEIAPVLIKTDIENDYVTVSSKESVIAKVPEKVRKTIKKLQNDLFDFFRKKTASKQHQLPEHKQACRETDGTDSRDQAYSEIDEINDNSVRVGNSSNLESTTRTSESKDNDEYPEVPGLKKKILQRKKSSDCDIRTDFRKHFESLTTNDLCQLLSKSNMESFAIVCYKESLDGYFFTNISDDELMIIFSFNNVQLKKFKKIRDEGWVPK